jgi:hypothetical protein
MKKSTVYQFFDKFEQSIEFPIHEDSTNVTFKCKPCYEKYKQDNEDAKYLYESELNQTKKDKLGKCLIKIEKNLSVY